MKRLLPDLFTVLLVCTVAMASVLPIHGSPAHWFAMATNLAIALLFFLHGARLSRDVVLAGMLHWRLHLMILLTTFAVFPAMGLAVGFVPEKILPAPLYAGILFLCMLPSTVQSSIAFTSIAKGNVPAAICAASLSNIVGMFATPLLASLLLSPAHGAGFSMTALETIMLQLLAPFLLGQLLQPLVGNWIRARKKLLAPVDRGSILMVVYLAFSDAVTEGLWRSLSAYDIATVIAIDMAVLLSVLLFTTVASRALGFSKEDEIAIAFCGSKKSLASGIPMASAIFAGPTASIGAVVLPLMFFHQIQLMACAVIAHRYTARLKDSWNEPTAVPATGSITSHGSP